MYKIRHLLAPALLEGGADLAAVSNLLGHSSTQMTVDVYYELPSSENRRGINMLPSLVDERERGRKVVPSKTKMLSKDIVR